MRKKSILPATNLCDNGFTKGSLKGFNPIVYQWNSFSFFKTREIRVETV